MFNFQVNVYPSICRGTMFLNHICSHQAPKPSSDPSVPTPFTDENGDTIYGHVLPTDDEIAFKKAESLRCALSRAKKNINNIANSGTWKWFCTFTFDQNIVGDRYDYDNVCSYMRKFLNNMRTQHPDLQYLIVPELHKDGAYHFHGLFSAHLPCIYEGYFKSVGDTYHVSSFKYGFSTATIVKDTDKVSNYITKYITKDMITVTPGRRRYWWSKASIDINKPLNFFLTRRQMCEVAAYIESNLGGVTYNGETGAIKFQKFQFSISFLDAFIDYLASLEIVDYESPGESTADQI